MRVAKRSSNGLLSASEDQSDMMYAESEKPHEVVGTSMNIRLAVESDFGSMWPLFQQVVREETTYVFASDTPYEDAFAYWFSPGVVSYVAEDDGQIVGMYKLIPTSEAWVAMSPMPRSWFLRSTMAKVLAGVWGCTAYRRPGRPVMRQCNSTLS